MNLKLRERTLNAENYSILVRDFLDENSSPLISEIRVFDRKEMELTALHRVVRGKDRVETINDLKAEIKRDLALKKRGTHAV